MAVNWLFFLLHVINVFATSLFYLVSLRLVSGCVSVQGHGASRGRKTRGWGRRRLVFLLRFRLFVLFVVLFLVALDAVSFVPA